MIDEPTIGSPGSTRTQPADFPEVSNQQESEHDEPAKLVEAICGHSPFTPDAERNIPKPGPIPVDPVGPSGRNGRTRAVRSKGNREPGTAPPVLEKEQIENLKREQYAYHCQMCLWKKLPEQLAPVGSYIEHAEIRFRVIEAHHVDLVSGGGARHAGNIIILCKYHHDNYGRQLSRRKLVDALLNNAEDVDIRFEETSVEGRKVKYLVESTGEVLGFFFTKAHADMWLGN